MLLFLQRCVWGIPFSVIRRCITRRLNSEFWKNGTAFRNSGLNYTMTWCPIPKERNSRLNYTVTQQPPFHTENGGKKFLRNVSTYQSSRRHITKDSNHNDPRWEDVTYRKARSFEALPTRPLRVSSNSWFVFGSCPLRIKIGTLAVLSEEFLRFLRSLKTSAGVGDSGSAAAASLHIFFNSSAFSHPTVRHWTTVSLQRPSINTASSECHLVSAVCVLMRLVTWVILPKTCVGTKLQGGVLRLFLLSTSKCDLIISVYHQYCLNKKLKLEKLPDSRDDLCNVASTAACQRI